MKCKSLFSIVPLLLTSIASANLYSCGNNQDEKVIITFSGDDHVTFDGDSQPTLEVNKDVTWGSIKNQIPSHHIADGYREKGWFIGDNVLTDETKIVDNTTVQLKTELIPVEMVTVTFSGDSQVQFAIGVKLSIEVEKNSIWYVIKNRIPSYKINDGYGEEGWYIGDNPVNNQTKITENTTILLKTKEIPVDKVNVTFFGDSHVTFADGEKLSIEVNKGIKWSKVTKPKYIIAKNYVDIGWYDENNNPIDGQTEISSNMSVTIKTMGGFIIEEKDRAILIKNPNEPNGTFNFSSAETLGDDQLDISIANVETTSGLTPAITGIDKTLNKINVKLNGTIPTDVAYYSYFDLIFVRKRQDKQLFEQKIRCQIIYNDIAIIEKDMVIDESTTYSEYDPTIPFQFKLSGPIENDDNLLISIVEQEQTAGKFYDDPDALHAQIALYQSTVKIDKSRDSGTFDVSFNKGPLGKGTKVTFSINIKNVKNGFEKTIDNLSLTYNYDQWSGVEGSTQELSVSSWSTPKKTSYVFYSKIFIAIAEWNGVLIDEYGNIFNDTPTKPEINIIDSLEIHSTMGGDPQDLQPCLTLDVTWKQNLDDYYDVGDKIVFYFAPYPVTGLSENKPVYLVDESCTINLTN